MDKQLGKDEHQEPISLTNFDTALSLDEGGMDRKDVPSILQATASHFSKTAPTSSANDLIQNSNDEAVLQKLEEVLTTHFHPLNLTTLPSVVVYLLLNYFLLRRENKEVEAAKKLYEDHIALLKEKNTELEERWREGNQSAECQSCKSCDKLRRSRDTLSEEYTKLKQSYDELCHINGQWALDYEALSKQIANATGFHSVTSSSSSGSSQSHRSSSQYAPDPSCVRCGIYESQLEDKQQEIDGLRAMVVGLREDIKESKERLGLKQRELSSLENEYQIVRLQMQEIGDMQQTLNMKQDYRKMQRALQHKTKQYQDAVGEKLELQKQVEKLRQTFLKFFPTPKPQMVPAAANNPTMPVSRPPHSGGYYSFPMHSCRHNIQSHVPDPTPPTPPGLLARGDLRGGYVEKDEHPIPMIRLEDQATTMAAVNHGYPHLYKGSELVNPHLASTRGNMAAVGNPEMRMSRSYSNEHVSQFHSSDNSRSGDPSSQQPHSMVPITATPSPNSTYTNTSMPSTISSLGYGSSEDPSSIGPPSLMRSSAPNLHYYSPRSKGSLGTLNSGDEAEFSSGTSGSSYGSGGARPRMQKSLSQESAENSLRIQQQQPRPTSLVLPGRTSHAQQQFFSCPNCKRTFSCTSGSTFEPWFEHIKVCGVQK